MLSPEAPESLFSSELPSIIYSGTAEASFVLRVLRGRGWHWLIIDTVPLEVGVGVQKAI